MILYLPIGKSSLVLLGAAPHSWQSLIAEVGLLRHVLWRCREVMHLRQEKR